MDKRDELRDRELKRRAPTIHDVARRAGVSTATVSRTLATPGQVTPATRSRVTAAIGEIGYTPNVTARNLRAKSTRIVLALVPSMANTFFTPILNAIEDTFSAAGYGVIIGDTRHDPQREAHYTRLVRAGQVDGVILFTGELPRGDVRGVADVGVPIVLVCNEIPGETAYSVFDSANRDAARTAVRHLLAAGHRRIAHIAGPADNVEARQRLAGYGEALAEAGLAPAARRVWNGTFRYEAGVDCAYRYLAMPALDRPTAVFAAADDAAVGFIKTLKDAGIRTPVDVSVIGFDDIECAHAIDPPLTTMRQPRSELGRAAAADLLERMANSGRDLPPSRLRLACQLVVRESVRPLEVASESLRETAALRSIPPAAAVVPQRS